MPSWSSRSVFLTLFLSINFTYMLTNSVNAQELVPLELYWSSQREDNFVTVTPQGGNSAIEAGYNYVRVEACVFSKQQPGTVPLNLYWSDKRGDNFTTATSIGVQSARQAGYTFARVEGYAYPANMCQ